MRTGPNTGRATTDQPRRCRRPQRAHGPPSCETNPIGVAANQARRETRYTMATITKLRNKIENVSALKGWRMRWHMQ